MDIASAVLHIGMLVPARAKEQNRQRTDEMKKKSKNILEELLQRREENISLLSRWTDEDIEEMIQRYREAKEIAEEENRFESYKILEEKLSQLHEAKRLKFSYTEEASDWIHW